MSATQLKLANQGEHLLKTRLENEIINTNLSNYKNKNKKNEETIKKRSKNKLLKQFFYCTGQHTFFNENLRVDPSKVLYDDFQGILPFFTTCQNFLDIFGPF